MSWYDRAGGDAYEQLIAPDLPDFVSPKFEELCQEAVYSLYEEYTFDRLGRWWYRDQEIDVIGLTTEATMVAGECTFTNTPVGYDVLSRLESDVSAVRWPAHGTDIEHEFCLVSKRGSASAYGMRPMNGTISGSFPSRTW